MPQHPRARLSDPSSPSSSSLPEQEDQELHPGDPTSEDSAPPRELGTWDLQRLEGRLGSIRERLAAAARQDAREDEAADAETEPGAPPMMLPRRARLRPPPAAPPLPARLDDREILQRLLLRPAIDPAVLTLLVALSVMAGAGLAALCLTVAVLLSR